MLEATVTSVAVPSQLALDNIVETLSALGDELSAIVANRAGPSAMLNLHKVEPEVWHLLPGTPEHATEGPYACIWKYIARTHGARIAAFCAHEGMCPDLPQEVQP